MSVYGIYIKKRCKHFFSKVATAHASLLLTHCKQLSNESLITFIYRWEELLVQRCGKIAEQCRDKLDMDLFLCNKPIKR